MKETIRFSIGFVSEFWDKPPMVDISIDHILQISSVLDQPAQTIVFDSDINFGSNHVLSIKRHNKSVDQCRVDSDGKQQDQFCSIKKVCIDGIDVQNLIWHRSWFEPDYPEPWAQSQRDAGIVLESKVIGETWLSHNGTWFFEFTSPFYKFLISQFRQQQDHALAT